jgi:putative membrane protein
MKAVDLPTLNAILNALCAILLLLGFIMIKQNKREAHKKIMLASVIVSALFLISYVVYHYQVGSVPYPHHDWTRTLYFIILIPHVILAAVMVPFIIAAIRFALLGKFDKHKRLVKWVWPVWMFVSLSGLAVYTMLYQL